MDSDLLFSPIVVATVLGALAALVHPFIGAGVFVYVLFKLT